MSETTEPDRETDGEAAEQIVVADAEDYNQSQRLKSIHRARRRVREAHENVTRGKASTDEHNRTRREFASAVAYYGQELLPLMDEADWEQELDAEKIGYPDVRTFVRINGRTPPTKDWDRTPEEVSLMVFEELNKFVREIGLGVDFEDDSNEWEV